MTLDEIKKITNGKDFFYKKNVIVRKISSIENSDKESIVFIFDKSNLSRSNLDAGLFIIPDDLNSQLDSKLNKLVVQNPREAYTQLAVYFKQQYLQKKPFCLTKNCDHKKNLTTGKNVVIHKSVILGKNVILGHNVVIHENVVIGDNVEIGAGSIIGSEGFGNFLSINSNWQHLPHIGGVIIGSRVSIGSNCCIDKGMINDTVVSNGVIIDNLVHIAHNVKIGENTAIAAKVGIAGSCVIGKRNMIGGMVGIVDHIKTADDVIISATSTVYKDINKPGIYTGIMPISNHATWKRIALWITKLDKIAKFLNLKRSKL